MCIEHYAVQILFGSGLGDLPVKTTYPGFPCAAAHASSFGPGAERKGEQSGRAHRG